MNKPKSTLKQLKHIKITRPYCNHCGTYLFFKRPVTHENERMFKEQPDVVTDEDVGNFIKELYESTPDPLGDEDEDMVRSSQGTSTGT